MAPLTRAAIFVAIDIEPLVRVRIVGGFEGLEPATGKRNEELAQRVVADYPGDGVRLRLA